MAGHATLIEGILYILLVGKILVFLLTSTLAFFSLNYMVYHILKDVYVSKRMCPIAVWKFLSLHNYDMYMF